MDIWIKIRSLFEDQGAKEAAAGMDKLADSAKKAEASTGSSARGALGAAHVLHGLEEAAHGSERGLFAAANGAQHFLESMGMMASAGYAAILFAIAAGIQAVATWLNKQAEAAAKAEEAQDKLQKKMEALKELRLEEAIAEYDRLGEHIRSVVSDQEKLNEAQSKMKKAETAAKLAKLDLAEAQELAGLKPGDEIGRKQVQVKYAGQRKDIESAAAVEESKDRLASAQYKDKTTQDEFAYAAGKIPLAQKALNQAISDRDEAKNAQDARDRNQRELEDLKTRSWNLQKAMFLPGGTTEATVAEQNALQEQILLRKSRVNDLEANAKLHPYDQIHFQTDIDAKQKALDDANEKADALSREAYRVHTKDVPEAQIAVQTAETKRAAQTVNDTTDKRNEDAKAEKERKISELERQKRAEEDAKKNEEQQRRNLEQKERDINAHLHQAEHHQAKEDFDIQSSAHAGKISPQQAQQSMNNLVTSLIHTLESTHKGIESLIQLASKHDSKINALNDKIAEMRDQRNAVSSGP